MGNDENKKKWGTKNTANEDIDTNLSRDINYRIDLTKYQGLSEEEILDKFRKDALPEIITKIHSKQSPEPCQIDLTKYQGLSEEEILDKFRKDALPEIITKIHSKQSPDRFLDRGNWTIWER
jgi:hypothetical protein